MHAEPCGAKPGAYANCKLVNQSTTRANKQCAEKVCCNMWQCVCGVVLQSVAVYYSMHSNQALRRENVLQCVAVCCSVFAVCCSVHSRQNANPALKVCAICGMALIREGVTHTLCCSVLQCVAVCCSLLQCVAVCQEVQYDLYVWV